MAVSEAARADRQGKNTGEEQWGAKHPAEVFKLVTVASTAGGAGIVSFRLMREHGTTFDVCLSAGDADRLCQELPQQIDAARMKPRKR
jgi:hypothetical protein